MPRPLRSIRLAVAVTASLASLPATATGQSLLDRTPNLSGGWLGERGTLQFNFIHRFIVSDAPTRKVSNSPTFLLSYRLPGPLVIGMNYATNSDVAPAFPNEWEAFARYSYRAPLMHFGTERALQVGYNQAARSVDAELTGAVSGRRVRAILAVRFLSNAYHSDTARFALGGGAVLRLNRWLALSGDATELLEHRAGEKVAWGAGLQIAIPYSPHSLSLQVTNTNTATLQGASRGTDRVRGGFEFTIPFTLSRYFGRRKAAEGGAVATTTVEMRAMAFSPQRLAANAGATIEWTNRDQIAHTVTADDGSWDSGPIEPGATWRHTFETPGTFAFHCSPHPYMTGAVVIR